MVSQKSLDETISALIAASKKGFEWRVFENSQESMNHHFYDPLKNCYDATLKDTFDKTYDASVKDFFIYGCSHPVKFGNFISSIYAMRSRVLKKETE